MEENIVHYIGVDGAKIGRHNSNHIPIVEESVSRYHSEIVCKDKNFYIRDIGSTSGTFIKLKDKIRLEEGMLLEIGSYLFLIEQI
jgi:pSer/pThr/pTyr-binding forkhead associated (FHA) protein